MKNPSAGLQPDRKGRGFLILVSLLSSWLSLSLKCYVLSTNQPLYLPTSQGSLASVAAPAKGPGRLSPQELTCFTFVSVSAWNP